MAFGVQDGIPISKECKKVCKQLTKDGWTVYMTECSLEESLAKYNQQLETGNLKSIIGFGVGNSIDIALRKAINNAKVQYASLKGVQIEGREINKMKISESAGVSGDSESFTVSYVNSINQKVKPIKPHLVLKRQLDNKKIEVQVYCLVETP